MPRKARTLPHAVKFRQWLARFATSKPDRVDASACQARVRIGPRRWDNRDSGELLISGASKVQEVRE
jgi:hypothetical protein